MSRKILRLYRISKYMYELRSGDVLLHSKRFDTEIEAEEYYNAWITSFECVYLEIMYDTVYKSKSELGLE